MCFFFDATIHFISASAQIFIISLTVLKEFKDGRLFHNAAVWSFGVQVENPPAALTRVG
jgi:hypothetical protein